MIRFIILFLLLCVSAFAGKPQPAIPGTYHRWGFDDHWRWKAISADSPNTDELARFSFPIYDPRNPYWIGGVGTTKDTNTLGDWTGKIIRIRVQIITNAPTTFAYRGQGNPYYDGPLPPSFRLFMCDTDRAFNIDESQLPEREPYYWWNSVGWVSLEAIKDGFVAEIVMDVDNTYWSGPWGRSNNYNATFRAGFESVRRKRGQWMLMGGGGKFFDTGVKMESGSANFVIESFVVQ